MGAFVLAAVACFTTREGLSTVIVVGAAIPGAIGIQSMVFGEAMFFAHARSIRQRVLSLLSFTVAESFYRVGYYEREGNLGLPSLTQMASVLVCTEFCL